MLSHLNCLLVQVDDLFARFYPFKVENCTKNKYAFKNVELLYKKQNE